MTDVTVRINAAQLAQQSEGKEKEYDYAILHVFHERFKMIELSSMNIGDPLVPVVSLTFVELLTC